MSSQPTSQPPNPGEPWWIPLERVPAEAAPVVPQPAPASAETVRLNFNVSLPVALEVRTLASDLGITMTQLFRYAFGILKIAASEAKRNRKLVIADENGTPLREFILPGIGG